MVDTGAEQLSQGQQLLALGVRQGAYFTASILSDQERQAWADYRSEAELRSKVVKAKALLVIVSQDCDIACRNDSHDPCIEMAVFSPIREKDVYPGNQFTKSVRKLQFKIGGLSYEAKVRETIRVPKQALYTCLTSDPVVEVDRLTAEQCRTLVLWRANRYQREALPDRFNLAFQPILEQHLPKLESLAQDPDDSSLSYIRALYVYLDSFEEQGECNFSLLALLRVDTPNGKQSELDDAVEELCQALEAERPEFSLSEAKSLAGLAERESTITVATLGQYVKYNLDSVSLSQGDPDVGV